MRRVLRAPLLHFLVLGTVLLVARGWWERDALPERTHIVFTAADLTRLRTAYVEEHGDAPGPAAEAALLRAAIDEEVLYREAVAAGFDRGDAAVGERLARLGSFLGEDPAGAEREARRLGLERSDVVIRRHLVEMMRLATFKPGLADLPSDADLQGYLDAHAAEFATPPTVRVTQVYLGAATHGARLAADAEALLADLRRTGAGPDAAHTAGDPFLDGPDIGPASPAEVHRRFGREVAAAVEAAPLATWVGPVRSSYGLHLLWVRERDAGRAPPLAAVRSRVVLALLAERGRERSAERMRAMRARYAVEIARP